MLKILHLNPTKTWRGGEQQTLYLAKYLQNQKEVEQILAGTYHSELQKECQKRNIPYKSFPFWNELDVYSSYKLAEFLIKNQIQILHCHTAKAHSLGLLTKWFCEKKKYPIKLIISRRVDFSFKRTSFFHQISRWKYHSNLIDCYIAISEKVKSVLISDGIDPQKIEVIYSGIDLERYKKSTKTSKETLKKEFQITDEIIIGNVAALVDHKDHETLILAASILKSQPLPKWKIIIVGDGEKKRDLQTLIRRHQLENEIILAGFRKNVFDFYQLFDIFAMSSKEEGLGTSILDAMVFGLPIVATNGGGIPEIVQHQKGGFISPIRDSQKFATHLKELILKPSIRKKMGRFNQDFVKNFDYRITGEKTLNLYKRLWQE
ncbi:MAG: glycosyltransferase [Leptospiraceae bacterium]|nr:glycosyltransferase [Leptospiraceae bacterium]MDW7976618.1 glycosyltransferase [Leptospiraceae bacterium]